MHCIAVGTSLYPKSRLPRSCVELVLTHIHTVFVTFTRINYSIRVPIVFVLGRLIPHPSHSPFTSAVDMCGVRVAVSSGDVDGCVANYIQR